MIYDTMEYLLVGGHTNSLIYLREEDSLHCVYSRSFDCPKELRRNHSINGQDPYFPWFNLGNDTGFDAIRLDESD